MMFIKTNSGRVVVNYFYLTYCLFEFLLFVCTLYGDVC